LISTQATTCSKPSPSCRTSSGDRGGSWAPRIRARFGQRPCCRGCARDSPTRKLYYEISPRTISVGSNLAATLARPLLSEQLLPVARQALGDDHGQTLNLNQNLTAALKNSPESTRDDLRLTQHRSARRRHSPLLISTQATTCSKPRPSCRTWSRGDGGSSAPRIPKRSTRRACYLTCARDSLARSLLKEVAFSFSCSRHSFCGG